jgi:hypothetical protein
MPGMLTWPRNQINNKLKTKDLTLKCFDPKMLSSSGLRAAVMTDIEIFIKLVHNEGEVTQGTGQGFRRGLGEEARGPAPAPASEKPGDLTF